MRFESMPRTFALGILTAILIGCSKQDVVSADSFTPDPTKLSDKDAVIFKSILKSTSPGEAVVFVTSQGQVLSNRRDLLSSYHVYRTKDDYFTNSEGKVIRYKMTELASETLKAQAYPCTLDSAGPYYRVKTKPGSLSTLPGSGFSQFSYARADLTLPSGSSINMDSTGNGYIMFGGWGRASTPSTANAADVGLQYNPVYSQNSQEDYSIFLVNVDKSTGQKLFTTGQRYKPGSLSMAFYVYADDVLALRTDGTPEDSSAPRKVTTFLSAPGWKYSGQDNVIKRLTSITVYSSGEYFRGVEWAEMYLGRRRTADTTDGVSDVVDNMHSWGSYGSDIDVGTDGVCASPSSAISVEDYAPALEIVSIY